MIKKKNRPVQIWSWKKIPEMANDEYKHSFFFHLHIIGIQYKREYSILLKCLSIPAKSHLAYDLTVKRVLTISLLSSTACTIACTIKKAVFFFFNHIIILLLLFCNARDWGIKSSTSLYNDRLMR